MILAQKEFKDAQGGFITFGTAFSTGFRYALFTGLMMAVFMYVYYSYLSPEMYEKIADVTEQALEKQEMSSSQMEKTMSMTREWGPLFSAFGMAVGSAIIGAIISLITSAIIKKERSPYDIVDEAVDPE